MEESNQPEVRPGEAEMAERELLKSLLDRIPDSIYFKDKESRFIRVSKSKAKHLNAKQEEIVGKTDFDFYPRKQAEKMSQDDNRIMETEEPIVNKVEKVTRPGGELRWVSVTKVPLYNQGGDIIGILGISRDITERKKIEQRLKAIGEISRQMKLAEDKDQVYDLVIDCTQQILGYKATFILEFKDDRLEYAKVGGDSLSEGKSFPLDGKGITVACFNKGEPIYVPDTAQDPRYIRGIRSPGSEYAVPISMGGKKYGVLDVEDDELNGISINDRSLLEILASEMAVALTGLRRMEKINESRSKLRELHNAVDQLQMCNTEELVCQTAVEVAENILDFHLCALDLRKGDMLIPQAVSKGLSLEDTKPHRVGEAIAGKTIQKGETMWGDDVRELEEGKPVRSDFRSFISVPIGNLGVFQVVSTQTGNFTREDVELAEILVAHLREEIKRVRVEEQLRQQAIRDPLTNLYNRRYFNQSIRQEVERAKRYGHPLSFLMIDIDDFKEVNDRYSHLIGDKVLCEMANLLTENIREADTAVRYGGDEFLIILPETNGEVIQVKDRIRDEVERWNRENDLIDFSLTLSMGASYLSPDEDRDVEEVLKEADLRMYKDKDEI